MHVKSLEIRNFRNYLNLALKLNPGLNVFVGENAQGKTNIVEALYYSSSFKSHRTSKDRELIKWDKEKAEVLIEDKYTLVELFIDGDTALVYKKYDFSGIPLKATLDVVPKVINNTVYVPLRFVAESIDASVQWDSDKNEVLICTKKNNNSVAYEKVSKDEISDSTVLSKWYEDNKINKGIYFIKENDSTYIMVSGGMVNTGGYSINLNGIVQDTSDGLRVYACIETPSKDSSVIQVISYPSIIIKIKSIDIKYINGVIY
jgi:AAA15 family ATPase/GTPase